MMYRRAILVLAALVVNLLMTDLPGAWAGPEIPPSRERQVRFIYETKIGPIDMAGRAIKIWIPLPRVDALQRVSKISVDSDLPTRIVDQSRDGNRLIYLEATAPLPREVTVRISFDVTRKEESPDLRTAAAARGEPTDGRFAEYLQADALVPTTGRIARISAHLDEAGVTPFEQARIIYEYVTSIMSYDKTGTGWGRGDAIYACDVRRGNCTDFHSLFIALARASRIPARFTIGFPLGSSESGRIPGYHCWAEFYAGGQWIPVDASEAWKHPARHDYYFGHLDADRVAFTRGRDLALEPAAAGSPVNFLVYPYVQLDGRTLPKDRVKNSFSYSDLPG